MMRNLFRDVTSSFNVSKSHAGWWSLKWSKKKEKREKKRILHRRAKKWAPNVPRAEKMYCCTSNIYRLTLFYLLLYSSIQLTSMYVCFLDVLYVYFNSC